VSNFEVTNIQRQLEMQEKMIIQLRDEMQKKEREMKAAQDKMLSHITKL
jgi:hypothetical protein